MILLPVAQWISTFYSRANFVGSTPAVSYIFPFFFFFYFWSGGGAVRVRAGEHMG